MKKARMYFSFLNEQNHKSAKSRAADKHNLRFDQKNNPNFNPDWSKNNLLFINGKPADPLNIEENYKLVTDTIKKIKSDYNNHHQFESLKDKKKVYGERDKIKRALNNWANNEKLTEKERGFWSGIIKDIENKKVLSSSQLLAEFEALELGKVQRYNDKIKRISSIETLNPKETNQPTRIAALTVISKELLFKIPDQYQVNLDPEDWIKATRNIVKKIYPEFDTIYEAVHCDENPENSHIHIRLSGLNNKTHRFDIGDALLNKFKKKLGIEENKTYSQLNDDELKMYGELTQDVVFNLFNKELKTTLNNKYNVSVHKRTPEEVAADPRKFEDAKLASVNREFNAQNKLKEENKALKKNNKIEIIKAKKIENYANQKEKQALEAEKRALEAEKIAEAETKKASIAKKTAQHLMRVVKIFKYCLDQAELYKKTLLIKHMDNVISSYRKVDEISPKDADSLYESLKNEELDSYGMKRIEVEKEKQQARRKLKL